MTLRKLAIMLTTAAAVALSVVAPATAATPLSTQDAGAIPDSGAVFTPLPPTRIFDSRDSTKIQTYSSRHIDIPADLVPDSATALVFNLTGTDPDGPTFLASGPGNVGSPSSSNLNLAAGETRANLVTVAMGHGAGKGIWIAAGPAAVDAIIDLAGYYAPGAGSKYSPLTPQRVLDTRNSSPLGADGTVTLDLSSEVPAGATAAVFNLTATDVTGTTFVTAYPADQPRPDASNLNLVAGKDIPNLVTVALSPDRKVKLTNSYWSVDLVADLAGYYSLTGSQAFYSLDPARVLETRDINGNPNHPILAGQTRRLDLSGWLPAGATAAVFNLTGTNVTGSTFVTAWADGAPQPDVSNLNLEPGQTSANLAIAPVSGDRAIDLNNRVGQLDAIVDLAGYFAPGIAACAADCAFGSEQNYSGQFGNGTTDSNYLPGPTLTYGLAGVKQILGSHDGRAVYALKSDGTVWAWGENGQGQLGIGKFGYAEGPTGHPYTYPPPAFYSTLPVQIPQLTNIVAIADEMALDAGGHVYTWGVNDTWQLGNGSKDDNLIAASPVQVSNLDNVKAVAESQSTATGAGIARYALKTDGTVWSWGDNSQGALGIGTRAEPNLCLGATGPTPQGSPNCASAVPVQVLGVNGCDQLAARAAFCAKLGGVLRWGASSVNAENDGPVLLPAADGTVAGLQRNVIDYHGVRAILADGTVWQWNDADGLATGGTFTGKRLPGLTSIKQVADGFVQGDRAVDTGGNMRLISDPSTVVVTGVTTIGAGGYGVVGTP